MKRDTPMFVGNWKSFVSSPKQGVALLKAIDKKLPRALKGTVVVCPPAPILAYVRSAYGGKRIHFGTQDISEFEPGAHTGETAALLAKESGAGFTIIGHAERREQGETDERVSRKVRAALDAKLTPIVCVGELERDRDGHYFALIEKTVSASLARITAAEAARVVIAYEPVWAIGASSAPEPRTIAEAIVYIRKTLATLFGREVALKVKILYGGAVDAQNAVQVLTEGHAHGFLIGRASVSADAFADIIRVCQS